MIGSKPVSGRVEDGLGSRNLLDKGGEVSVDLESQTAGFHLKHVVSKVLYSTLLQRLVGGGTIACLTSAAVKSTFKS